jgi:hypothetical protein
MANLLHAILHVVRLRAWFLAIMSSAVALAAACARMFESEAAKQKRAEEKRKKDLRALADKIALYAQRVRQQFPKGTVVVSERDLAEQLRKRPDSVVTALNVLLKEQKVQRTRLTGYWKLHA